MKKILVFLISMMLLTSCSTLKHTMEYKVIHLYVDHIDKYSRPTSYDAVIKININYYSALLDDKLDIIYIDDFIGDYKEYQKWLKEGE